MDHAKFLEWQTRIQTNGPTPIRYAADNLPAKDDPGWIEHRERERGKRVRLINVHGPFELDSHGPFERCESGWLGLDEKGEPFAISDSDYASDYEAGG